MPVASAIFISSAESNRKIRNFLLNTQNYWPLNVIFYRYFVNLRLKNHSLDLKLSKMQEKTITTLIREFTYDELSEGDRKLVDAARESTRNSYAPYSKFHVGAAILMANGEIVCGANQENAAFSSGTCAERSACFYASANYPGMKMVKIAIAAWTRLHHPDDAPWEECFQALPISPCGACRQALLEYETLYGPIEVILYGSDRVYVIPSVSALLPLCFTEF